MAMDSGTKRDLAKLLKKIDIFTKNLRPLRNKLARSLGQQKRQRSNW